MNKFPSLKQFLLLNDKRARENVLYNIEFRSGKDWIEYYERARNNWERFGDEGPPKGTLIQDNSGVKLIVEGPTEDNKHLKTLMYVPYNKKLYWGCMWGAPTKVCWEVLMDLRYWWMDIIILEEKSEYA